jgi:hypothetical protein
MGVAASQPLFITSATVIAKPSHKREICRIKLALPAADYVGGRISFFRWREYGLMIRKFSVFSICLTKLYLFSLPS